ncbi:MAG: ATP-binding protein [Geopsychrobacter sp.]|nr:ATP-binding protein [Geopsychrobacter sp.]
MSGRVLIIDSNKVVVDQVEPVLGAAGLRVFCCQEREEACEQIREQRPQLVLLDASLAQENTTFCQQLRSCAPEVHLPIILLVPPQHRDLGSCLCSSDADDFVCFPLQDEELLVRVLSRVNQEKKPFIKDLPRVDYRFLAGISKLANSDLDTSQVLQRVVAAIGQVIEVHRCSITMVREDDQFGYVMASNDDPDLNGLKIDLEKYPEIRETIRTGKPILIDNINNHPIMEGVRPYIERLGFNSLLVLPMVDRQRVIGVLVVRTARSIEGFAEEEISFCQLVANVATSALRFARLADQQAEPVSTATGMDPIDGELFETRGALLDMAAHDLRVLVSVIDGYCLLLQETETENLSSQQSEFVDGLTTGCRRLVELTNNLLDFSRIEAGKLELDVTDTDLRQIIESATQEIQPLMRRRGIKLKINCTQQEVPARCDVENIRRVFYNLMSNAIKFTPQGGTIELKFAADSKDAYVSVSDSGPGISAQLLPRLFEEFSHRKSPDGQHGTGLGLSICKRIVDAHHGRIWAESVIGQGSCFTFSLPQNV